MPKTTDSRFVGSLSKAFLVLNAIQHSERGLSLGKIQESTALDISTVQRCVFTLVELGFLIKDTHPVRAYRLASRFLDLSYGALRQDPMIRVAAAHIDETQTHCPFTIWFSVLDADELLYTLRKKGESYMKSLFAGRRVPLYCTAGGRAVMSHLADERVREILKRTRLTAYTPYTLTGEEEILKAVEQAGRQGYAVACQEIRVGEIVAGSAVLNHDKAPIGAVHVSAATRKVSPDAAKTTVAPVAVNVAELISADLANYRI